MTAEAVRTAGAGVARHSLYNLLGQGSPFLAAVFAIPLLVSGLGTDRFGVLTIAWMIVGYFGLFDLGLGRALTQVVARTVRDEQRAQAPQLAWGALVTMTLLGLAGSLVLASLAPWMVYSALKIPAGMQQEAHRAFLVLSGAIPVVTATAGLVGILSAFQRFGLLNAIRVPMGIYTFLAPLAVLPFSRSLVAVTAALVVGRVVAAVVHFVACRPYLPAFEPGWRHQYQGLRPLLNLGAWMTVSNLVSPLMVYLDRFVIGAMVSVAAVAYYVTPWEAVTKLLTVPAAIMGVLFPAFAASHAVDRQRLVRLYDRGTRYIGLMLFPVVLVVASFAHEILQLWLGDEFARQGTLVLQWLAIGVFVNSLAQVFFTLVQGVGRPDLTGRLHLAELPLYLAALWLAIRGYGIVGAAVVWTGRMALDGAVLLFLSSGLLGERHAPVWRTAGGVAVASLALASPMLFPALAARVVLVAVLLGVFALFAWWRVLAVDERLAIRRRIGGGVPA